MSSFKSRAIVLGFALGWVVAAAPADVIHLKDGGKIEGAVKHSEDGWVVRGNGKTVRVLSQDVESIELTPTTSPSPRVAGDRLDSLRRSVESLGDLSEIIARFQRFVDQSTDPAVTTDARKDLAMWQDRLRQKMVKVGLRWVTPTDRDRLVDRAGANAETARQLMKQGRSKEAEPLLLDVVSTDPQNATGLYLTGLLKYQQEQLPASRKALEATAVIIPNHAPTLNNLAVVEWRQHQYVPGMQNFDAAMLAAPVDKSILDNVAVALHSVPIELQKSPVTLKLLEHFNAQDQKLIERMAQQGMHRFGSLWVTDKDLEQFKVQEKQIQDKLDDLSGQFDRSKQKIDQLSQTISDNQSEMRQIEGNSYVIDPRSGVAVQVPYPSTYYDLQRDSTKSTRERDAEISKLDGLKKQAQDLQNSRPSIKSQGVMQVIGPEGTPIRIAAAVGK